MEFHKALFPLLTVFFCLANGQDLGGSITLFEGNYVTQNQVCSLAWSYDNTWNFQDYDGCQNDEARSAKINSGSFGTTITLYDDPNGSKDDDFTVIKLRGDILAPVDINTFENSFTVGDVEVTYHSHNGLDGKVSRMEVSLFKEGKEEIVETKIFK